MDYGTMKYYIYVLKDLAYIKAPKQIIKIQPDDEFFCFVSDKRVLTQRKGHCTLNVIF